MNSKHIQVIIGAEQDSRLQEIGNKVIQNILGKLKVKTGDAFIVHRLKSLAVLGKVEIIGNIEKGWKDWSVKLAN